MQGQESPSNDAVQGRTVTICTFGQATDITPKRQTLAWPQLVTLLTTHDEREQKDGLLWSPTIYRDGTTRGREGVEAISIFVGDIDHDGQARYESIRKSLENYSYIIYSTHSHSLDDMRFRVVIQLTRDVLAADWADVWTRINHWLLGNAVDPGTKDLPRIYYLPSCRPGTPRIAFAHAGEPLDPYSLAPVPGVNGAANNGYRKPEQIAEKVTLGLRHHVLVSLAGTLRRRGLGADDIEVMLRHVNETRCDPPRTAEHVRKIAEYVATHYAADDDLIGTVHYVVPDEDEEPGEPVTQVVSTPTNCPPLPDWARIDDPAAYEAGTWITEYQLQSRAISPMSPGLFHESAALVLASAAIARRLKVHTAFGTIYPNIWTAWIAPTTLWHKTTALNYGRGVALRAFPHLLASNEFTPESLLSDLSGAQPKNLDDFTLMAREDWLKERNYCAQRTIVQDEMSGLLASAGKDYNQGMIETLMQLYDCNPDYRRSTRGQGRINILNSYLSFIGASTPRALAAHMLEERLWAMGWWPRFALLTPDKDRPDWIEPTDRDEPDCIINRLVDLHNRLPEGKYPTPARAITVELACGVYEAWQRYGKAMSYDLLTDDLDRKLWGTYGRLPVHALKVATILAALDWGQGDAPVIEMAHLARAVGIVEEWRASAHRALASASSNDFDIFRSRVFRQVGKEEPNGISLRNVCRMMRDKKPSEIEDMVLQMVKAGDLESMGQVSTGGRPAEHFRIGRDK